ncbi:DUF5050 domain-containing protein [Brevibacillus sp. HB1.3]|uniref:DUF5050 domain-containing protein n=1 Tax=Brevibacillus sp. HB1.3 TaxID=2738842 RepID=UPI0015561C10|nr:DUF5050 domain-containing protein [Brevibacillus sp. HB1.3]NQF15000.1 DUF5050 domain-containing protein [Brevibacillus sp. HB1.3]
MMKKFKRLTACAFSAILLCTAIPATIDAAPQVKSKGYVAGDLTLFPQLDVNVGEKVTVTATIAKHGKIKGDAEFRFTGPDEDFVMEDVKVTEGKEQYEVTGTFTPSEKGKYEIKLTLTMKGEEKQEIQGAASGIIRVGDEWKYFFVADEDSKLKGTIYKDKLVNESPMKVSQAKQLTGKIFRGNQEIYYLQPNDPATEKGLHKSSLYKVKQGSSTPEAVKFAGDKITSFVMDESDMYFTAYTDDNRAMLYKAKINSDKKEEVLENVDYVTVSNGWYYFHESLDQGLYKMKLNGSEKTKLTKDDTKIDGSKGGSFEVYTDAIAYVDSSSRHVLISKEGKYLQDGKQLKGKIVDVVGDNIFYLDSDKALYRTQISSDKPEKILDLKSDAIVEINVPAQYILYAKTNNELYKVQWK